MSWNAIPVECEQEDTISGSLKSSSDGSLYFGDEQKYDNWIIEGIEFYILNYSNYVLFSESNAFNADNGTWFVIHYNNSIYMKTIEGTIHHTYDSEPSFLIVALGLLGLVCLLSIAIFRKRK
jgi:hypothetical protein